MRVQIFAVAALTLLWANGASAAENRELKCKISAARADRGGGGPALVANIPKAMTPIDLNAVLMTDKAVRKAVIVEGLFARRTETDTLEVTARFVNCTKEPISVQVRSNFMDQSQVPTEPSSVWKTVYISPRSIGTYQERSIATGNVAAYLVELRTPQ